MKKTLSLVLVFIYVFCLVGCESTFLPKKMPTDFSFSLTWGTHGTSSYDSKTGKLVKTAHATNPEDYIAYHELSNEEKDRIYEYIRTLNPDKYPDIYNPNEGMMDSTPMTLVLTVYANGSEKTIKAEGIVYSYNSNNLKGKKFLSTCEAITMMLILTEEWKSLPDYEFYYQ